MKVYISEGEAYPVYSIETDLEHHIRTVVIPDELYQRYMKVGKEYDEIQEKLSLYFQEIDSFSWLQEEQNE